MYTKVLSTSSVTMTTTDRLQFAVSPSADFSFDNIRTVADDFSSTRTFAYNGANEMTSMTFEGDTTTFTYDNWGRQISKYEGSQGADYSYAYDSKMTEVSSSFYDEGDVDYEYRGDGKRHKRTAGSDVTVYDWDREFNKLSEENGSGTLLNTYISSVGVSPRDDVVGSVSGSNPSTGDYTYFMGDNLSSTRSLYDQSKALDGEFEYTPYGDFYRESGSDRTADLYTGHEWDSTSQLYFAPYRYYSPEQMRWTSRDPAGPVNGPNMFGYVVGNPLFYIDRLGLACGPGKGLGDFLVPDRCPPFIGASFRQCCKAHDCCYAICIVGRRQCDKQFKNCMKKGVCGRKNSLERQSCKLCGQVYFLAVRFGGKSSYNKGCRSSPFANR